MTFKTKMDPDSNFEIIKYVINHQILKTEAYLELIFKKFNYLSTSQKE